MQVCSTSLSVGVGIAMVNMAVSLNRPAMHDVQAMPVRHVVVTQLKEFLVLDYRVGLKIHCLALMSWKLEGLKSVLISQFIMPVP